MSDSERKTKARVTVLWMEAVMNGEPVRVCTVNGIGRILIGEFDIRVPGKFDQPTDVISAYQHMIEEQALAYAELVEDSDDPSCADENCGLIPITREELDQQLEEFMKNRGKILNIFTGKWR